MPPHENDDASAPEPDSSPEENNGPGAEAVHDPDDPSQMTEQEFEDAVGDALDQIPEQLMNLLDNVVFFIEEESPEGEPELLGVYDGIPITERDASWGGELPDRITIFRGPTLRLCETRQEVIEEVAVTVVHEIAHFFGIDDDKLHEWGWG